MIFTHQFKKRCCRVMPDFLRCQPAASRVIIPCLYDKIFNHFIVQINKIFINIASLIPCVLCGEIFDKCIFLVK